MVGLEVLLIVLVLASIGVPWHAVSASDEVHGVPLSLCGDGRILSRKLLQQVEDIGTSPEENRPVEVDSTVQLCMPSFNTYYFPFANGNRQIVDPVTNLKASSRECCASCLENDKCNAWQWCPVEVGCSFANTTGKKLSNTSFPYLGCQLLDLEGFTQYVFDLSDVKSKGENIPFIAGAPLNVSVPDVDGYEVFPGNELGSAFDFKCDLSGFSESPSIVNLTDSLVYNSTDQYGCMIQGSANLIAAVCSEVEECLAFNFYRKGLDPSNSQPTPFQGSVGILKTGDLADSFVTEVELNPNAAIYVEDGLLPESVNVAEQAGVVATDETDTSSDGTSTVVIAVVASVVGVVLIAALIGMVYYIKRYQKMTRSFPSTNRSSNDDENNDKNKVGHIRNSSEEDSSGDFLEESAEDSGSPTSVDVIGRLPRQQTIVVSEVPRPNEMASFNQTPDRSTSPPDSMPAGSSARDLMDAFSQMYKQRPAVDYLQLGSLLEDDESKAAAELEAAVEESRKSSASASSRAQHRESTKIPSVIAHESSGLADAGLVDDWSILPEEVEVCRRPDGTWWQLGTGGFGTVYKGLYHGVHSVAIKIIHHIEEERHKDSFIREASLLKALRHKNVVQFLGACLDGPHGTALLVTELMELGDLWRALSAKDPQGERIFSWYSRGAQCLVDVARGLHYLHSRRVVHFDLKSANILLSRAGTAKLADIGMARVLNKSYLSVISGLGTFAWSAPEVLAGKRCTEKADIFSFGVVLWEICTGEAPARGDMRPLQAPEDCPQEIVDLYQACTAENPDDRPTAKDLLDALGRVCDVTR